jgi:hypothetical protein
MSYLADLFLTYFPLSLVPVWALVWLAYDCLPENRT